MRIPVGSVLMSDTAQYPNFRLITEECTRKGWRVPRYRYVTVRQMRDGSYERRAAQGLAKATTLREWGGVISGESTIEGVKRALGTQVLGDAEREHKGETA